MTAFRSSLVSAGTVDGVVSVDCAVSVDVGSEGTGAGVNGAGDCSLVESGLHPSNNATARAIITLFILK